jgi:hypothetical protein
VENLLANPVAANDLTSPEKFARPGDPDTVFVFAYKKLDHRNATILPSPGNRSSRTVVQKLMEIPA